MAKTTSDEKRERLRQMTVAFLAELTSPPEGKSRDADEEHALRVDGLASDLLDTDAEGAILFLGDLVQIVLPRIDKHTPGRSLGFPAPISQVPRLTGA